MLRSRSCFVCVGGGMCRKRVVFAFSWGGEKKIIMESKKKFQNVD